MERIDFVKKNGDIEVRLVLERKVSKRGDRYYIAIPAWSIRSGLLKPGEKYTVVISTKPYEELKREEETEEETGEEAREAGWELLEEEEEDGEEELEGVVFIEDEDLDDEDWDIDVLDEDEDI